MTESQVRRRRAIAFPALLSLSALINLPLWLKNLGTFWSVVCVVWTIGVLVLLATEILRYLRAKRLEERR